MNAFFATGTVTWVGKLQQMPKGGAVLDLGFAVDKYPKDAPPIFTTLKLFQKYAEVMASSLEKGQRFAITGQLRLSQWEKDGIKHEKTYFVVSEMKNISSRGGAQSGEPAADTGDTTGAPVADDEPMPF